MTSTKDQPIPELEKRQIKNQKIREAKARRRSTPEGLLADRKYYRDRYRKLTATDLKYREKLKVKSRLSSRRRQGNYLSPEDESAMLWAQGGRCAICRANPGGRGILDVDHCHETGKIRGMLCRRCNVGLGMFRDRAHLLAAAQEYLSPDPT